MKRLILWVVVLVAGLAASIVVAHAASPPTVCLNIESYRTDILDIQSGRVVTIKQPRSFYQQPLYGT